MERTAQRVAKQQVTASGGLETIVDAAAYIIAGVAVLGMISALAATDGGAWGAVTGIGAGAFFQWLLLRCLAELLRLQKKQAGLDYQGKISGPTRVTIYCCSLCQSMLHSENTCDMCGAKIIGEQQEDQTQ